VFIGLDTKEGTLVLNSDSVKELINSNIISNHHFDHMSETVRHIINLGRMVFFYQGKGFSGAPKLEHSNKFVEFMQTEKNVKNKKFNLIGINSTETEENNSGLTGLDGGEEAQWKMWYENEASKWSQS